MKVIIAEKPSVAREIARVVRATNKKNGYIEGGGYAVTWALGHLITAAMPEAYGIKSFRKENLPILPPVFTLIPRQIKEGKGYKADAAAVAQLKIIEKLFRECEGIIVATDAGREGELIFRFIYEYLGIAKPFDRLWISSLTDKAIKEGLAHLQSGAAYDNLYYAARARSEADWLVGINATQAISIAAGRGTYSLGRVQTPTLCMVCSRFLENKKFEPQSFWQLSLAVKEGDESFRFSSTDRWFDKAEATALYEKLRNASVATVETIVRKEIKQEPPLLYDFDHPAERSEQPFRLFGGTDPFLGAETLRKGIHYLSTHGQSPYSRRCLCRNTCPDSLFARPPRLGCPCLPTDRI